MYSSSTPRATRRDNKRQTRRPRGGRELRLGGTSDWGTPKKLHKLQGIITFSFGNIWVHNS